MKLLTFAIVFFLFLAELLHAQSAVVHDHLVSQIKKSMTDRSSIKTAELLKLERIEIAEKALSKAKRTKKKGVTKEQREQQLAELQDKVDFERKRYPYPLPPKLSHRSNSRKYGRLEISDLRISRVHNPSDFSVELRKGKSPTTFRVLGMDVGDKTVGDEIPTISGVFQTVLVGQTSALGTPLKVVAFELIDYEGVIDRILQERKEASKNISRMKTVPRKLRFVTLQKKDGTKIDGIIYSVGREGKTVTVLQKTTIKASELSEPSLRYLQSR